MCYIWLKVENHWDATIASKRLTLNWKSWKWKMQLTCPGCTRPFARSSWDRLRPPNGDPNRDKMVEDGWLDRNMRSKRHISKQCRTICDTAKTVCDFTWLAVLRLPVRQLAVPNNLLSSCTDNNFTLAPVVLFPHVHCSGVSCGRDVCLLSTIIALGHTWKYRFAKLNSSISFRKSWTSPSKKSTDCCEQCHIRKTSFLLNYTADPEGTVHLLVDKRLCTQWRSPLHTSFCSVKKLVNNSRFLDREITIQFYLFFHFFASLSTTSAILFLYI